MRGKDVTLTSVNSAVAVRPNAAARSQSTTSASLTRMFGSRAIDTAHGGRFGIDLPARNRQCFEKAGIRFVEPGLEVARAASMVRTTVAHADTVHEVFVDPSGNMQVTTDILVVQVDPEMTEAQAQQRLENDGLRVIRPVQFAPNMFEVRAMSERPLRELVQDLQEQTYYQSAEPMLLQAITGRFTPTDPRYALQWQHFNSGGNGGTVHADIRSQAAWDLTKGASLTGPVRIAVIDNSMQVSHKDLAAGIVGGGYFKSNGFGSATFTAYQSGMTGFPSGDHGTFCMGMAGARAGNARGGCGSAPESALLPIGCLADQIGTQVTLARAVAFAADPSREISSASASAGADIIVSSLGPNGADWDLTSVLDLAIRFAASTGRGGRGSPIFWAVSNGHFAVGRDEVSSHPDIIAVGRSDQNDLADGSAFGPELAFLAPGVDVYSTYSGGRYGTGTGTSYAAPLAAGIGALVLARFPDLTAQQVRERMLASCDKIGGVVYDANGHHPEYGHGRINAALAVQ
jgi:thermitase